MSCTSTIARDLRERLRPSPLPAYGGSALQVGFDSSTRHLKNAPWQGPHLLVRSKTSSSRSLWLFCSDSLTACWPGANRLPEAFLELLPSKARFLLWRYTLDTFADISLIRRSEKKKRKQLRTQI